MKTLYLECTMGAAGDMLTAALLELVPDPDAFLERMRGLSLPGVGIRSDRVVKCGITGTHVTVTVNGEEEHSIDATPANVGGHDHDHHDGHGHDHDHFDGHGHDHDHHSHDHGDHEHDHHDDHGHDHDHHGHDHHGGHSHTSLGQIRDIISALALPQKVRDDAIAVYTSIAEAEAHVHGSEPEHIHFHEVGTMDAVADVLGVCLLMYEIAPDRVVTSPIHVGSGHVRCAHGILPVPAPATAWLLRDIPIHSGNIRGELCTPTGAALLRHFSDSFGPMPVMRVTAIGYGMGTKDFEAANCVRAMLGEESAEGPNDNIVCLECNLDDMTGEDMGSAMQRLFDAGARDVWYTPIHMKKGRPGQLLSVLCTSADADRLAALMLRCTTTIGVRRTDADRYALKRSSECIRTAFGRISVKRSEGYGVSRVKPEYDDIAAVAAEKGVTTDEVRAAVLAALKSL